MSTNLVIVTVLYSLERMFLKEKGYALLAVKSRSVDVTKKPGVIFKEVRTQLEKELIVRDGPIKDLGSCKVTIKRK